MNAGWSHVRIHFLPVAALAVALGACGGSRAGTAGPGSGLPADAPPAVKQAAAQGTAPDPALVAAGNAMGLSLLARIRQASPGANLLTSPLSLGLCLGMIYNGSAGATTQAMAKAMQLGAATPAQLCQGNAALLASLYTADPSATLRVANSAWVRSDILPSFLDANRTYYGAQVGGMDGMPGTANTWAAQATQGKIQDLLPAMDYSRIDAILVNALYFKGSWASAFDPATTQAAPFTRADGSRASCPMMHQPAASAACGQTDQAQVARLPYGNGRFAMVFLLPAPGTTLDGLAAALDPPGWNAQLQALREGQVDITLPRFTARWNADLSQALSDLGMAAAFSPAQADFSALSATPHHLAFVRQATTVEVDEAGTVASAATAGGLAPTSVPRRSVLVLDHPFFYAIQDTRTGALLFLGVLMDPTAG